jgi:hypothetical protein
MISSPVAFQRHIGDARLRKADFIMRPFTAAWSVLTRARARAHITRTVSMKLQVPGLADHGSIAQGLIWGPALHFVIQHAHADVCVCLVT